MTNFSPATDETLRRAPLLAQAAVVTVPLIAWSRDIAVVTLVLAALGMTARYARHSSVQHWAKSPAAICAALFLVWSAASVLWAPHLPWQTWLKTGVSLTLSGVLMALLPSLSKESLSRAASAVLGAALALAFLLAIERMTGGALIGVHRESATVFQRLTTLSGGLVLLCTTCFACGVLLSRYLGALIAFPLWIAAVLGLSVAYPMDAELVAVISGAAVFVAVLVAGRKAAVALMAMLLLGMVGWGFFAESAAGAGLHHWLIANVDPNWGYRVEIWRYVNGLIKDRILIGYGFDAARVLGESAALMPSFEGKTSFLHPHNGMLQVWLELGLVGVALLIGSGILAFRAFVVSGPGRIALATVCATLTTTAIIWSLSFGAWQGWWLAVLGLTAACLTLALRERRVSLSGPKRILFLATEYYLFDALKSEILEGARRQGYDIFVAARRRPEDSDAPKDITVVPFYWKRSSSLLISLCFVIPDLVRIGRLFNRVSPDVLHNIALKASAIGSLAAFGRNIKVINAIHGFGFLFMRRGSFPRMAQVACGLILKLSALWNGGLTVLLNRHDLALARDRMGIPSEKLILVHGTGIDLNRFTPLPDPKGTFAFLVIGRLLYMKGIDVAVEAHRLLRERGLESELVVCGSPDPDNPSSIPENVLAEWKQRPGVVFSGQVDDVRPYLARCHVLIHPSLGGEGLPRALTEAAASERALIATDIPGNSEVVTPDQTGLLVPPGSAGALADAMQWMMEHDVERRAYAAASRKLVEEEFSSRAVMDAHTSAFELLALRR